MDRKVLDNLNSKSQSAKLGAILIQNYSESALKQIGKQCRNRLPPASAVQAMFLYEMQRQTEVESLFHGQMFQLANVEDRSETLGSHVAQLFEQTKALRQQIASKDIEERLSTSSVRVDALQGKMKACNFRMDQHTERLESVEEKVSSRDSVNQELREMNACASAIVPYNKELVLESPEVNNLKAEIDTLNEDISLLFDERDALATYLKEAHGRIDEVEKQAFAAIIRFQNETSERVSKVEQQAVERVEKAEQRLNERIDEASKLADERANRAENQAKARIEKAEELTNYLADNIGQEAYVHITKVEQLANDRLAEIEKHADERCAKAEQRAGEQIASVEQLAKTRLAEIENQGKRIADIEQDATKRINNSAEQAKQQMALAEQQVKTLIGEIERLATKRFAGLEKDTNDRIEKSVNQIGDQVHNIWDHTSTLKLQFQSHADEQNDRIAKLEGLVRALTGQHGTSSPTLNQLLPVQTSKGEVLSLSVPKGSAFVSQKKDNIAASRLEREWMTGPDSCA